MTAIAEKCVYSCGPYKGYGGEAEYDSDAELFHGEVTGTRDIVTFQGRTPVELRAAFQESVDDYLDFCKSRGESPEKPYSGKFVTRIGPETHRRISALAEQAGKSLNQFISDQLEALAQTAVAAARTTSVKKPPASASGAVRNPVRPATKRSTRRS